jgi:hypothetical protein
VGEGIDSGEDIGEIFDRIEFISIGRGNQGHQNCRGSTSSVGAHEQNIFSLM